MKDLHKMYELIKNPGTVTSDFIETCNICKNPYPDGVCRKSHSGLLVCKQCDGEGPGKDSLTGKRTK